MKSTILIGAGIAVLGSIGAAQAQPNPVQGTPWSTYPYAARNEVEIINGVPCRTALVRGTNTRVPVECAEPLATGSIGPRPVGVVPAPAPGAPLSGTPQSLFPFAAPNEVEIINGVPCRTMLIHGTHTRVPVACAQ